jgi:hypothetical protein
MQKAQQQSAQGGFATENAEKKCTAGLDLGTWDSVNLDYNLFVIQAEERLQFCLQFSKKNILYISLLLFS